MNEITAKYTTANKRLQFEVRGANVKEVWQQIAVLEAVFGADTNCGLCNSDQIVYHHHNADGVDFYEMRCNDCQARLKFGQHKQGGTLWAKVEEAPESRGWHMYVPQGSPPRQEPARVAPVKRQVPKRIDGERAIGPKSGWNQAPPANDFAGITDDDVPF